MYMYRYMYLPSVLLVAGTVRDRGKFVGRGLVDDDRLNVVMDMLKSTEELLAT